MGKRLASVNRPSTWATVMRVCSVITIARQARVGLLLQERLQKHDGDYIVSGLL
jgi:hypothetical protein